MSELSFLTIFLPAFSLANRLLWNTSLQTLVQHCECHRMIKYTFCFINCPLQPLSPSDTAWNAWGSRVAQVPPFTQVLTLQYAALSKERPYILYNMHPTTEEASRADLFHSGTPTL